MAYIDKLLEERDLPALGFNSMDHEERRQEIVKILSENIYGYTPDFKSEVKLLRKVFDNDSYGCKTHSVHAILGVTTPCGMFEFPIWYTYPKSDKKVPLILNLHFDISKPYGLIPDEEIHDRGVAVAKLYYNDITNDCYDDFSSGIAAMFPRDKNSRTQWGKIGMWAWGASRALDYLLTLDLFDTERIAVGGHSRLGKTSLWCGAQDTRFTHVFSNNAGCSGDAITRNKQGEDIAFITQNIGYWFCDKYFDYAGENTKNMPFDQHFLLAAISPRRVAVGASHLDIWADPVSEYLCCAAASEAWEVSGLDGFVAPRHRLPEIGENFDDGNVAFHLREGQHDMIRADWMAYVDFLLK